MLHVKTVLAICPYKVLPCGEYFELDAYGRYSRIPSVYCYSDLKLRNSISHPSLTKSLIRSLYLAVAGLGMIFGRAILGSMPRSRKSSHQQGAHNRSPSCQPRQASVCHCHGMRKRKKRRCWVQGLSLTQASKPTSPVSPQWLSRRLYRTSVGHFRFSSCLSNTTAFPTRPCLDAQSPSRTVDYA